MPHQSEAFQRFEKLAKALIAVPREELKKQLASHKRRKKHKKSRRSI